VVRRRLPPWLRLGLEAGVLGAVLSTATLIAFRLGLPEPRVAIPNGVDGALILSPAVLSVGLLAVSYPAFLAATREEAVLGGVAAFMIAADLLMAASVMVGQDVMVHPLARELPLGTVAAALALPVAVVGLVAGQLTAPFGFGRSTGLRSSLAAGAAAFVVVLAGAYLI
jgi:hypothetical protein